MVRRRSTSPPSLSNTLSWDRWDHIISVCSSTVTPSAMGTAEFFSVFPRPREIGCDGETHTPRRRAYFVTAYSGYYGRSTLRAQHIISTYNNNNNNNDDNNNKMHSETKCTFGSSGEESRRLSQHVLLTNQSESGCTGRRQIWGRT